MEAVELRLDRMIPMHGKKTVDTEVDRYKPTGCSERFRACGRRPDRTAFDNQSGGDTMRIVSPIAFCCRQTPRLERHIGRSGSATGGATSTDLGRPQ